MTYAPLTISAINHTAGTLTITAHGLVTGGGFVAFPRGPTWGGAIFAAPGSGGVIPSGLVSTSTYWPIVVDANTIKLADSNAHAMAGTAVTFSDNGTLPLQFLVGLPYRVPRISAAGSQVFSDDHNNDWQAMVALWNLLTGQAQSIFSGVTLAGLLTANGGLTAAGAITLASLVAPSGTAPLKASTAGVLSVGYDPIAHNIALAVPASGASISNTGGFPSLALGTSTQACWLPLVLPIGFRIASWQVQLQKASATGTIAAQLWDVNGLTAVGAQVGSTQSNNQNAPGDIQLGQSGLSTVVTAGHSYLLVLQGGGVTGDFALGYSATPG